MRCPCQPTSPDRENRRGEEQPDHAHPGTWRSPTRAKLAGLSGKIAALRSPPDMGSVLDLGEQPPAQGGSARRSYAGEGGYHPSPATMRLSLFAAAHVEPERRILVPHQSGIGHHPVYPTVEAHDQVK